MSASNARRPGPWTLTGQRNPDLALLFGAAHRQRRRLGAWYPWVPAPPARIGGIGCTKHSCYPVGALILLWQGWSYFRGPCPDTAFRATGPAELTTDWTPTALVAVLDELGETRLPDPRSLWLVDPLTPTRGTP